MTRTSRVRVWTAGGGVFAACLGVWTIGLMAQTTPLPERLVQMRHHFAQVSLVHDAIIRGDLAAVQAPATELASLPVPAGLPMTAERFVAPIRRAGRRAADATSLRDAAAASVAMLTECGNCHRAMAVSVVPARSKTPDVGGVVGHMLEHQRAADEMLQGLFIPSPSTWQTGAARFATAVLRPDEYPTDSGMTANLKKVEARVHAVATAAADDVTDTARAARYAQLITTCAECHSLHKRVWGPTPK